jgi:hypothetical protein
MRVIMLLLSLMCVNIAGRTVEIQLSSGSSYNEFLQLAVQSAFDWVFYWQSNRVRLSVIPTSEFRILNGRGMIIVMIITW